MNVFKFFLAVLMCTTFGFAQKTVNHKVLKGETLYGIAKKYEVKIDEILVLNPKIKNKSLKLNEVIKIPNSKKEVAVANVIPTTHKVVKGDTFYNVSKKYGLTLQDLTSFNPNLSSANLKIGDEITLLKPPTVFVETIDTTSQVSIDAEEDHEEFSNDVIHVVKAKETLYKIAKLNNTSLANLKELNPEINSKNLEIGYHIIVKKGSTEDEPTIAEDENAIEETPSISPVSLLKADMLINKAHDFLGVRYRYGGTSKSGIDCSGLMCETFKEIDLSLPRNSLAQSIFGKKVKRKNAEKGDLIFFATSRKNTISHVGLITEVTEEGIKFIHASTSSGVIVSSLNEPYYSKRFKQVTRVLE